MSVPFFPPLPKQLPPWPTVLALAPFRPDAGAVAGLFADVLAKEIEDCLAAQPTDGLFASAAHNMRRSATQQAAERFYDQRFSGKLWEVQRESFIAAVMQVLAQALQPEKTIGVYTRDGIAFIDIDVVEATQTKEKMAWVNRSLAHQKSVIDRAVRTKITKLFREREMELMQNRYPQASEVQIKNHMQGIKRHRFGGIKKQRDAYLKATPLDPTQWWVRMIATWLYREKIALSSWWDFSALMHAARTTRCVEEHIADHARGVVRDRGHYIMATVSKPRDTIFSPEELDHRESYLNKKYASRSKDGRLYCQHLYHQVRHIQKYGMTTQEIFATTSHLPIYQPTPKAPPKNELFPEGTFPPPKPLPVGFTDAVTRVIESHPHRYEQDVLWQLFFRYNYRHKYIKPLPEELQSQARQHYRQRKQRARVAKKQTTTPVQLPADLFADAVWYEESLIDFLVGRIDRR